MAIAELLPHSLRKVVEYMRVPQPAAAFGTPMAQYAQKMMLDLDHRLEKPAGANWMVSILSPNDAYSVLPTDFLQLHT